jgi:hypothetical protein
VVERTLRARDDSWYVGANIPGRARVFMPYAGGVPSYRARCEEVAATGYPGFTFKGPDERRPMTPEAGCRLLNELESPEYRHADQSSRVRRLFHGRRHLGQPVEQVPGPPATASLT